MDPITFYQGRLTNITKELKTLKGRLRLLGSLRLIVFIAIGLNVYFFFGQAAWIGATLGIGVLVFLALITKHTNVKNTYLFVKQLKLANELELRRLSGDLSDAATGSEYIFEEHDFNQDIDLFGQGSLFQWANRTALKNGEKQLAAWLNNNTIDAIEEKQAAIQELRDLAIWRQEYSATAATIQSELKTADVMQWMTEHQPFIPKIYQWLPMAFSIISVGLITTYFSGFLSGYFVFGWYGLGLALSGRYVKRVSNMYNTTSKIDDLLRQYSQLLQRIEVQEFKSELLKTWKNDILTEGQPASHTLRELSKEIDALGNRNNLLFGIIGNGLLLWDARCVFRIERWMNGFNGALNDWFTAVERIDAMNSLANFAFNHPTYIYPKVTENKDLQLSATALGHPLLHPDKMVTNDIELKHEDFFIITGANMAGKSTFLRTVAMNIVMANCGLPVCAKSFEYQPVKLISSMRTSDSLVNDESYFFSELKRLKYIVNKIQEDTYFIILDEILKGTNSVDKAEGSKKFVERLVKSKSTGLIATHDLSLCTLSEKYKEIQNHYFDAEIVNNELYFDYRFKDGICQNMNASFLLKKMEIVD